MVMRGATWKVAKFTLLPGILPRVRKLCFSGFDHIPFLAARAYASLRLLPPGHPYLNPQNFGKYGLRHVMLEARRRLVVDRYHLDQVVLYYTLMAGFLILVMQFGMMLAAVAVKGAMAGEAINVTLTRYFVTPDNATDIAYNMLDLIFAFPGIFDSDSLVRANDFHTALHILFNFYNVGIMIVGIIVFLYLVVTVIAETAESGTPFGRRFNGAWAPFRMIWAIGLLCPLTFGMNGGQLVTMHVAKWGSSLATNGWTLFINNLAGDTPLGPRNSLVALPQAPAVSNLVEFMNVARTCSHYEFLTNGREINGYIVSGDDSRVFLPYNGPNPLMTFDDARAFTANNNIVIRFGEKNAAYTDKGNVRPICGEMTYKIVDVTQPSALTIQNGYFTLLGRIWLEPLDSQTAYNQALRHVPNDQRNPRAPVPSDGTPQNEYVGEAFYYFSAWPVFYINEARLAQIDRGNWDEEFQQLGWAGAAIWYSKLTEMNGAFISAINNLPRAEKYPEVMEYVFAQKRQTDQQIDPMDRFRPYKASGEVVDFANPDDKYAAITYYEAQQFWRTAYVPSTNNSFLDTIKAIFGVQSLFSMRDNIAAGVHPLVQLISVGRGLIDSSIQNLGFSFGAGIAGGLAGVIGNVPMATIGKGAASLANKVAMMAFGIGFILFYAVPFMPFIYFLFSAGTWIKSIFQALVGIPLWALAHIRIDGEGLPGPSAMNGYYLMFEVFLRPVLILIGLIGGLMIFAAEAYILNEIWDLVTSNLTGFDNNAVPAAGPAVGTTTGAAMGAFNSLRGLLDRFMFTVLYAIVIYMMALSSFKMADILPDNIMRWLGARLTSFGAFDQNPAEGVLGRIAYGARLLSTDSGPLGGLLGRNGR